MISRTTTRVWQASLRMPLKSRSQMPQSRTLSSTVFACANRSSKSSPLSLSVSAAQGGRSFSAIPRWNSGSSSTKAFSSTPDRKMKNRVYTPVRRPDEFISYLHASTSARIPLVTLWTASYCPSCRAISPLLNSLVVNGVGESSTTSVNYCEVEFDSKDIMESGLGLDYMITNLPTLVTFDRGEVIMDTKVTDVAKLKDERWLTEWIENESKRRGEGTGGGGDIGGGLFGGLFGNTATQ